MEQQPRYAIGIDVGGTSIKAGVVRFDRAGTVLVEHVQHATAMLGSIEDFLGLVSAQYQAWSATYPTIEAIGIGFPACVQWSAGLVAAPPNIPWWDAPVQFPLRAELSRQLALPVAVDNDANVAALAECKFGVARQWESMLFVTLGTGVGGALIINGQLYRGERGSAGELGHMVIDARAPLSSPAFRTGILERYVGRDAILERARRWCVDYPNSRLARMNQLLDVEAIGEAARDGDEAARGVLEETAEFFGIGLASAVALLGIEHIVVAGGIAGLPELFFDRARATLRQRSLPAIADNVQLVRSSLGATAGVLGAALLALDATSG